MTETKQAGILVFSKNPLFITRVLAASKTEGDLAIQERPGDGERKSAILLIKDKPVGSAFLSLDGKRPFFYMYDEEDRQKGEFPWDYRDSNLTYTFDFRKTEDALTTFRNFIGVVHDFDQAVHRMIEVEYGLEVKESILTFPENLYSFLEFEFFRRITECSNKIEISVARPSLALYHQAFFVMIRVEGDDDDNIEVSDLVLLEKAKSGS